MCQNVFVAPRPQLGRLQHSPRPLAGFGEGNREGLMERAREENETEGKGKEGERKGEGK